VKSMLNDSFWFVGPAFLWQANIDVNNMDGSADVSSDDQELRKQALVIDTDVKFKGFNSTRFDYFSDWSKLKRAITLCLRYMAILKRRIKSENQWSK